jgi:hypothetical protein
MKALDLYKFIKDNNVEWHRQDNDGTPDVLMFPSLSDVKDFANYYPLLILMIAVLNVD